MSEPASTAFITAGVATGAIMTLPATNARDTIPEPCITTGSASRPYFSNSLASLVK